MADTTLYSEDKLSAMLMAVDGELLLVNRDGVIQYTESAESVLSSSFSNAEGAYLWDVFSQDITQQLMQAMSSVFLHNSKQELSVQFEEGEHTSNRKVKVVRCGEWEVVMLFLVADMAADVAKTDHKAMHQKIENMAGLIPMCSCCKNIRDSDGFWLELEVYLHKHANTEITHTMCPTCQEKWYK